MVYRIFKRADGTAPSVRTVVIALVIAAALLTAIGVIRVGHQHEVLLLGYKLSRTSEQLGKLHEARRSLELELATLAAPDRIRRLATQLGMTPVSPDRIRTIHAHLPARVGSMDSGDSGDSGGSGDSGDSGPQHGTARTHLAASAPVAGAAEASVVQARGRTP